MIRRLVRTGNSTALILTRDMKEHLGITDVVEVQIEEGRIILRKPLTLAAASARSDQEFGRAYKKLAQQMESPRFLTVAEVIELHRHGIERYGGMLGIRDQGLLESAVLAPQQTVGGEYVYPALGAIAAAYWMGLVQNHAFLDGNKRVGLRAADVFLMLNEQELAMSAEEAFELTMRLVWRELDRDELARRIEQCLRPLE